MDCVRYATTRSHAALDADGADVGATHHVAGVFVSAVWASGGSAVLRPLSAYGARLRRVLLLTVASQNPCANLSPNFCYNGRGLEYWRCRHVTPPDRSETERG